MDGVSSPLVLGVLALQLLLEFWVGLSPEIREAGRDLNGALVGGEDLDEEGDFAGSYLQVGLDSVEVLDAGG